MNTQTASPISACRESIQIAASIAARLERGQALTPLTDRFLQWQAISCDDSSTPHPELGTSSDAVERTSFLTTLNQLRLDCDLLADVNRQKTAYQKRRRLLLTATGSHIGDDRVKETCAFLKHTVDERLNAAEAELKDKSRNRSLPSSSVSNRIDNLMEDLSPADIAEESAYRVTRLTVGSAFLGRAESVMRSSLVTAMRNDVDLMRIATDELKRLLADKLQGNGVLPGSLQIPDVDESHEIERICELIRIDSRYHGELPQKNWMDRISHGRRPVFVIMMTASLVGSALGSRGGMMVWLLPLMLMMFVAGTIWTFRSFREERASRIERELIRLRDSIRSEMKRLYESLQKEWLHRAIEHLKVFRKCLVQPIDNILVQHQEELRRRAQSVSLEASQRRQSIEDQIRELEANALELTKLLQNQHFTGSPARSQR